LKPGGGGGGGGGGGVQWGGTKLPNQRIACTGKKEGGGGEWNLVGLRLSPGFSALSLEKRKGRCPQTRGEIIYEASLGSRHHKIRKWGKKFEFKRSDGYPVQLKNKGERRNSPGGLRQGFEHAVSGKL